MGSISSSWHLNNCADNSFSGNSSVRHDLIADVEAKAFPNNNVPAWSIALVQHLLDRLGALVDDMRQSGVVFFDYLQCFSPSRCLPHSSRRRSCRCPSHPEPYFSNKNLGHRVEKTDNPKFSPITLSMSCTCAISPSISECCSMG